MMQFHLEKSLEILEQTPSVINTFLSNLSGEWTLSNEGENTWSAFDIVGHLIHCEEADWIPRLKIILKYQNKKTFEPFDRFAQFEKSKGKRLSDLLETFSKVRIENVKFLKSLNLTKKELLLKGMHPSLGEVTAKQLLATWVTHDLGHIAQISRVMAKQYANEVGAWHQYISILKK